MNKEENKEAIKRVNQFLTTRIWAKDLALELRRLKLETVRLVLKVDEDNFNKEWVAGGLYYLNELCEALDPYLEEWEE